MRTLIITLFAICLSNISIAQNYGEIHGKILDHETGDPIPGATVTTYVGTELRGAPTDLDGRFKLKPLPPGKYDLEIRFIGYETRTIQGIEVTPLRIYVLGEVELAMDNTLPQVVIEGYPLINLDQPSVMVMKAADIKHNPLAKDPARLVGSITSELRTDDSGQFIVKGGRPGTSATFMDGVKLMGPLQRIPGSAIKTITVHTGGIPAKYGDVTGGVVVIETKSYFDYFYEYNASR